MRDLLGSVLVVDDEPLICDLIARRLRRRGYEVAVAHDGHTALRQIAEERFDLVLLDIVMPLVDGLQVLGQVRQVKSRSQLPVIMVTAKDDPQDLVHALSLGANDFVSKPIDLDVLMARIGTHVILKRTTETLEESNRRLEEANVQLRRDLEAAAKVQQAHLPKQALVYQNCRFAWKYEPCEQLGGDSLNIMPLSETEVGLYVLDVSGHGVRAALMSVAIHHLLEPSVRDTSVVNRPNRGRHPELESEFVVTSPKDVAEKLNRHFVFDPAMSQYFTILYGVFNVRDGLFRYVSTGHPPPLHLRADDDQEVLESSGTPIGLFREGESGYEPYVERTVKLTKGDRLYIYSDGIIEVRNPEKGVFGVDGLSRALRDARDAPLEQSLDAVFGALREWREDEPVSDDLSMVALDIG